MKSWWQQVRCSQKQGGSWLREIMSVVSVATVSILHVNKDHFFIIGSPPL